MGQCECDACYDGENCQFSCAANVVDGEDKNLRGECVNDVCICNQCFSGKKMLLHFFFKFNSIFKVNSVG